MLGIGLLALIVVFVIGLFARLNIAATKSVDKSVAMELAQRVLDSAAAVAPAQWDTFRGTQDLASRTTPVTTTYFYELDSRVLTAPNEPMGDLYRLDVEVSWWPADSSNAQKSRRRDYGKLHLRLSRVIWVEAMR